MRCAQFSIDQAFQGGVFSVCCPLDFCLGGTEPGFLGERNGTGARRTAVTPSPTSFSVFSQVTSMLLPDSEMFKKNNCGLLAQSICIGGIPPYLTHTHHLQPVPGRKIYIQATVRLRCQLGTRIHCSKGNPPWVIHFLGQVLPGGIGNPYKLYTIIEK